jgi:acetyl esterase/lipase
MPERLVVVDGPGAGIDRVGLARRCEEWGAELGVAVELLCVDTADAVAAALTDTARAGPGIVLQAGDAAGSPGLAEAVGEAEAPVAWADLETAERPPRVRAPDGVIGVVRGRGVNTYRWSLRLLAQRLAWPWLRARYGPGEEHVGELRLPAAGSGPHPVAVLLHGGFWRERWLRDTIEPLAIDLARRGYATWNLEYRRVGPSGGGWPATAHDVAAGIDHLETLAGEHPLDMERVLLVGHSAGGQLALWATHRRGIDGSGAAVRPRLVVSLAGVLNLIACARRGVGDTANGVAGFLGCWPEERPDVYAAASPAAALPLGVHQLVAHGWRDPLTDLIDVGRGYAQAAAAGGDPVELVELEGDDHFSIIEPASAGWRQLATRIEALVPVGVSGDANERQLRQ